MSPFRLLEALQHLRQQLDADFSAETILPQEIRCLTEKSSTQSTQRIHPHISDTVKLPRKTKDRTWKYTLIKRGETSIETTSFWVFLEVYPSKTRAASLGVFWQGWWGYFLMVSGISSRPLPPMYFPMIPCIYILGCSPRMPVTTRIIIFWMIPINLHILREHNRFGGFDSYQLWIHLRKKRFASRLYGNVPSTFSDDVHTIHKKTIPEKIYSKKVS